MAPQAPAVGGRPARVGAAAAAGAAGLPEHGGCVSWVDLPESSAPREDAVPALSDEEFARAEGDVEAALAAAGVTG